MERIVNEGSKSGFTKINTTSIETNPYYIEKYNIKKLYIDDYNVKSYGELPEFCVSKDKNEFIYIHPDWLFLKNNFQNGEIKDSEIVIPTSSSRTVRIENTKYYLKLCYPGKLGRIFRELKYKHLISGIELTEILNSMKSNDNVPKMFEFMPESCGKIFSDEKNEIGFLVRTIPETLNNLNIIPAFSLFSRDINAIDDELLLTQILYLYQEKERFFLEKICYPLIDIFFYCAFNEGLILEMHSQNVLYAFDNDWNAKKIIIRDLESVDKDITIRTNINKNTDFASYPYKCISDTDEDYYLRHSFMFDHKLGEYLLDPLVESISREFNINSTHLKNQIKEYSNSKYINENKNFFPKDGLWYKYPNIEIDRTTKWRPFTPFNNPMYR